MPARVRGCAAAHFGVKGDTARLRGAALAQRTMIESDDLFALAAHERLNRYRGLAIDTARLARVACTHDIRDGYRRIAGHWIEIAALFERTMRLRGIGGISEWQPPHDPGEPAGK